MTNVLLLTSSPRGEASYSTQIATELSQKIADAQVTVRELWRDLVPPIDPAWLQATFTPEENRTPEQRDILALSDTLIAELKAADTVIIGAGMINFGLPSGLKTWIDQITRAGLTFRYTSDQGPEGLVKGKKLILVLATGGIYSSGPATSMNHLEPPIRTSLGFLGLTDVEVVLIEGVAMGPEATEKALAEARAKVAALVS